jgi:hypothetical protein
MNPNPTPLESAEMWLAVAVAASGDFEHWDQEERIENFRGEVRKAFAAELAAMVRAEFPDPNPLASIFLGGWVGERIAARIEESAEQKEERS